MATEVTAYKSKDGKIYLSKNEAEYADFQIDVSDDIDDFLKEEKIDDKDGHVLKLLRRFVIYYVGGPDGIPDRKKMRNGVVLTCADEINLRQNLAQRLSDLPQESKTEVKQPPKRQKKKVGIVGIWPGNRESVKKEFGDVFDMEMYSADEDKKLAGLKQYDKVFALKKFISHRHIEILRSIGQDPSIISGSMNELRDALTNYAQYQAA